jgi:hypothetical protein
MTHKFSQWWISASLTLFVVAFVLLVIILRDQRKALTALDAAEGAAVADAMEDSVHGEVAGEGAVKTADHRAAVERGRIASLGGLTALIWLVILIFMVWH